MKNFREIVNEGTSASITVFDGKLYKTSYLQYDGIEAAKELIKNYNKPEQAALLVQKSGEIRNIFDLEFYKDRPKLEVTRYEDEAVRNANEMYIKYYFDGQSWYTKRGQIRDFNDMEEI